jgi:aryl-alcohol dehydrogenase-like predicted oxidoreductase
MPASDDTRHDTRPLGRSGLHMLPLGIGTNKWRRADRGAVLETYKTINDAGPCMIDTAEIYFSERVVGDCLRTDPARAVIATKFFPFPGRTSPRRLMSGLDGSLARLGLKTIDLYYVHFPLPLLDVRVFAEGLVEAVKSGKARAVGVANFGADQMRRIADHLGKRGIPLAANQVHYSLVHRAPETNGVLEACRELDVALVAYFPLASGRLAQPSDGAGTKALLTCLAEITGAHEASISQVALNWLMARDPHVIPIPGATKAAHASANLGALDWRLSDAEFDAIDRASTGAGRQQVSS